MSATQKQDERYARAVDRLIDEMIENQAGEKIREPKAIIDNQQKVIDAVTEALANTPPDEVMK